MPRKVSRNDPCPCGSGKKYKHCCGRPQRPAQVLYVHPAKQGVDYDPHQRNVGRPYPLVPVGLVALINVLRENGIQVQGINHPMERSLDRTFDLRRWLGSHRGARVVLIDLHWYEHAYGAISVAQACKEVIPAAWIVLGGLTASGFAREILEHYPEVDFVIRGDAEDPLLLLVQRLLGQRRGPRARLNLETVPNLTYRDGDRVLETDLTYCAATADLDRLNYVDIDFLEHHDQYYIYEYIVKDLARVRQAADKSPFRGRWLCTARGCRYDCSYCGGCRSAHQTLAGRTGIVPRSPSKVVDDLRRLADNSVIQASLSYDIAEMGEPYWRAFLQKLRSSGVRISLYNEFFQLPRPEFIRDFAQSVDPEHTCVALSPLSGSERVRRLNGKFYSNDELFEVLTHLNRYNLSIFVYFSLNLPGEDDGTIRETVELAERIYAYYPGSLLKILTSCHTIDPLSPMNTDPARFGIDVSMSTFADYYAYCRETRFNSPQARTEMHRGFIPAAARPLAAMADVWDAGRVNRESSWWPVPPGW